MIDQLGKVVLESKKEIEIQGEKRELLFQFVMPMGSPYGVAYDTAHDFLQEILKMADAAAQKTKRDSENNVEDSQ